MVDGANFAYGGRVRIGQGNKLQSYGTRNDVVDDEVGPGFEAFAFAKSNRTSIGQAALSQEINSATKKSVFTK